MRNSKGEFDRDLHSDASRGMAVCRRASPILRIGRGNQCSVEQVDRFAIIEEDRLRLEEFRPAIIVGSENDGRQLKWMVIFPSGRGQFLLWHNWRVLPKSKCCCL